MLTIHRSTALTRLADACASVLRIPATPDPLAPELLITSGPTHERWLRAHLARRLGVCAHVRVLSPSTLAEEMAERVLGVERDAARAWRAERLTWRVLGEITARIDTAPFAPVRAALRAHDGGDAACAPGSARAVAFARRVAGWYAGYAVGVPALARAWDAGAEPDEWQAVLWRALRAADVDVRAHPAALAAALAARRQADAAARDTLPARVVWMAQPGVARAHVDLLMVLAAAGVAVHALVPAAGRAASDSDPADVGHPLRTALGGRTVALEAIIRELAALRGAAVVVDDLDVADGERASARPLTSALAAVRRAVIGGTAAELPTHAPTPTLADPVADPGADDDRSIRVHACHGAMRQAEVLRDALLALFERRPDLHPRDVLVLTPDVAAYAPLLEAAFGGGTRVPDVPLRVVDRPARLANAAADVALRVLALAAGRVDAVSVLDLLAVPAVARRWELDGDARVQLRAWVEGAGARWGIDGADRAVGRALPAADGSAWDVHGWRFALERLLLGWGLPDDRGAGYAGAVPWDEIEGQDAEVLGRLAEACTRLFAAVRDVRSARPLGAWCARLRAHVDALVWDADAPDEDGELVIARRAFGRSLDALCDDAAGGGVAVRELLLEPAAVRALLDARFAEPAAEGGAVGAVTLAALAPGRVRPARVVALVGLDDGAFPRARTGDALDRRSGTTDAPDPGGEDRQAVLDALLAAEEHLIVTYTGRTARTNELLPPATPIALLLEAVEGACPGAVVHHHHALAPFGPRAASAGTAAGAPVFDTAHQAGARALAAPRRAAPAFLTRPLPGRTPDDGTARRVLTLDALADALARPARALVYGALGVWVGRETGEVATEEPLELDALQHHGVRAAVLDALEAGRGGAFDSDALLARLRAQGQLPHGALGTLAYEGARAEAVAVWHAALPYRRGERRGAVRVDQAVGDDWLTGAVGPCWTDGLVMLRPGVARAEHLVRVWVAHLALHATHGAAAPTSHLIALGKKEGGQRTAAVKTFGPVADAGARLHDLVALHDEATRRALPLLPASASAYVDARANAWETLGPAAADARGLAAATKAYDGDFGAFGEVNDGFVARLYGASNPIGPDFAVLARRVWEPLYAALGARSAEGADA